MEIIEIAKGKHWKLNPKMNQTVNGCHHEKRNRVVAAESDEFLSIRRGRKLINWPKRTNGTSCSMRPIACLRIVLAGGG
jgi:hypothetical protein